LTRRVALTTVLQYRADCDEEKHPGETHTLIKDFAPWMTNRRDFQRTRTSAT